MGDSCLLATAAGSTAARTCRVPTLPPLYLSLSLTPALAALFNLINRLQYTSDTGYGAFPTRFTDRVAVFQFR